MKHQFLKSALILSSVLALTNCDEEATNAIDNLDPTAAQPTENESSTDDVSADTPCWLLNADQPYLIYTAGIVTDINGSREIIIDGKNGVIIPPKDQDALYHAMKEFVEHPDALAAMAANARELVAKRFEQGYVRQCLYDFYHDILKDSI